MSRRAGQTLVESVFVLIVFVTLLLGIVDIGQMMFTRQTLADRVRFAARWASVSGYDESAIRNVVLYHRPEPGAGTGFLGLTAENVQVSLLGGGTAAERVQIAIVNYELPVLTPWFSRKLSPQAVVESAPFEP
jgi:hypothetical protein